MEGLWDFRWSQGATSNTSYARVTLHDSHWSYLTWSGEWPHHTAHSILTKTGSVIGCCLREGGASGCLSWDMSRVMSHSAKKLWIEIMILPCQTSCVVVIRREDHFTLHFVFWCQEGGNLTLAFSSVCRCYQIVDGTEQHRFSLMWHNHSRLMWLHPLWTFGLAHVTLLLTWWLKPNLTISQCRRTIFMAVLHLGV